jgi:uncharacterized protein
MRIGRKARAARKPNHRVYREPTPPGLALEFFDEVLAAPAVIPVCVGARHWAIFSALCRRVGARGNVVSDAFHAAFAIENGAIWITTDRFPGLRWRPLLDECSTRDNRALLNPA